MRRAEKAGRESADRELKRWAGSEYMRQRIAYALEIPEPSLLMREAVGREPFAREIGAHQLSGRAYQSALEAYDRGYRARLAEALADLENPTCAECRVPNHDSCPLTSVNCPCCGYTRENMP